MTSLKYLYIPAYVLYIISAWGIILGAVDIAYNTLKSKILAQGYLPGKQLKELQISTELGLTRTPVREAIIKLEREGIVKTIYNRGAFVATFSKKETDDIFDVREALETKAIYLATKRACSEDIDTIEKTLNKREELIKNGILRVDYCDYGLDFHFLIIKLSKNDRLVSLWQTIESQLSLMRVTSTMLKHRYLKVFGEHKKILAFIAKGNFRSAEKLIIKHIEYSKNNIYSSIL